MITKAVIPAAGFGTRFLPATKSQPKEMLPIVDKPTIQYVVEEAVESGIEDILMIIGKGKRAIEEHFDRSFELEQQLLDMNKHEELKIIQDITNLANIHFIWQRELNGLGDAIRYAHHHVNGEPFVILLGDTIIEGSQGHITKQLINVFNKYNKSVVALEEVDRRLVDRYGIVDGKEVEPDVVAITRFIEKPSVEKAPSNLAIASRYIFTPEIFDYLDRVEPGLNNEVQLTDAMQMMLQEHDMYGLKFEGKRYDMGNKLDFLKTNVVFGLKNKEFGEAFQDWLIEEVKGIQNNNKKKL
ncbi:MAG: UTP--glucose-1-phosphate uridylyltransferase GalU [Bacteroidales bacterium]|nr:UTP--glucose-1-phosphate uridylyltransferase GalU [Bacteroidales bacterium]